MEWCEHRNHLIPTGPPQKCQKFTCFDSALKPLWLHFSHGVHEMKCHRHTLSVCVCIVYLHGVRYHTVTKTTVLSASFYFVIYRTLCPRPSMRFPLGEHRNANEFDADQIFLFFWFLFLALSHAVCSYVNVSSRIYNIKSLELFVWELKLELIVVVFALRQQWYRTASADYRHFVKLEINTGIVRW